MAKYTRCPRGLEVQSLVFDDAKFTIAESRKWAKQHGFKTPKVDVTARTYRFRQRDPKYFIKQSFRFIRLTDGVQSVVACPRPGHESDIGKKRHRKNAAGRSNPSTKKRTKKAAKKVARKRPPKPPPSARSFREEFSDLHQRIDSDGIFEAVEEYSDWKEIKDPEFHRRRRAYVSAAKKIGKYVDRKGKGHETGDWQDLTPMQHVASQAEGDGLDYALIEYSDWPEVKKADRTFAGMLRNYEASRKKLFHYIEKKSAGEHPITVHRKN